MTHIYPSLLLWKLRSAYVSQSDKMVDVSDLLSQWTQQCI